MIFHIFSSKNEVFWSKNTPATKFFDHNHHFRKSYIIIHRIKLVVFCSTVGRGISKTKALFKGWPLHHLKLHPSLGTTLGQCPNLPQLLDL